MSNYLHVILSFYLQVTLSLCYSANVILDCYPSVLRVLRGQFGMPTVSEKHTHACTKLHLALTHTHICTYILMSAHTLKYVMNIYVITNVFTLRKNST